MINYPNWSFEDKRGHCCVGGSTYFQHVTVTFKEERN